MKFIHFFLITTLTINTPLSGLAQGNAQKMRDLYQRCTAPMRTDSQAAYEICKEYLQKYPDDDPRLVEFAKNWVTAYGLVLPYISYLRTITAPVSNSSWFIHEPDLSLEIPQVTQSERSNPVQIIRSFGDEREAAMLKRAEAVYPGAESMVAKVAGQPAFFAQFAPLENEPLWWNSAHSGVRAVYVVTARAIRYYYDLSLEMRDNPKRLIAGRGRWMTRLTYVAKITHRDEYTRGRKTFRDVYVADLNLEWTQVCGGLCGAGYKRNKVVVLDSRGEVVAMFLDAPENRGGWVS